MRKVGILALVFVVGLAGSALAQTRSFVLSSPSNSWGNYRLPGSTLNVVGKFNKNAAPAQPIAWNTSGTIEYTFYMTGMVLDTYVVGSGSVGDSSYYGAGGTISIYEGTPVNASLGTSPPNASSPSTFTDGTLILTGNIDNLVLILRDAPGNGTSGGPDSIGEARLSVTFTGGTRFDELVANCAAGGWNGWSSNTVIATNYFGTVPAGYNFRWSGELLKNPCPPISTEERTWGAIKGLYR